MDNWNKRFKTYVKFCKRCGELHRTYSRGGSNGTICINCNKGSCASICMIKED